MNRSITDILVSVGRLRRQAQPTRAVILDVLDALDVDDLTAIAARKCPEKERIKAIATELGYPYQVVAEVLSKFVRLDLSDFSGQYSACKECYQVSGRSEAEITRLIKGGRPENEIYFVLYGVIFRWVYTQSSLMGLSLEDNLSNELCIGFLTSKDLCFENTVDLLDCSFSRPWPNWQSLWRYY